MKKLRKEGSAYLPGRKAQPGTGFSAKAGITTDYPVNDPYTTYHNAIDNSQIWQSLMKESARQALGAQDRARNFAICWNIPLGLRYFQYESKNPKNRDNQQEI